jgi:ditrans,polycis-polyprenyl diphosphate synthase
MDGNRRYARNRGEEVEKGHTEGGNKLHDTLQWCFELGITTVTVFAFSIENFKRSKEEVEGLMKIAQVHLLEHVPALAKRARIEFWGDLSLIPPELRETMLKAQEDSKDIKPFALNVCFAYTATEEITRAVSTAAEAAAKGEIAPGDITPEFLSALMYSRRCSDPDVIVRTSSEVRLSDFLLWQSGSSLLFFYEVLWPEFTPLHLYATILKFQYQRYGPNTRQKDQSNPQTLQSKQVAKGGDSERERR